jgi:copper transport protein
VKRLLCAAGLLLTVLFLSATPAFAHAELTGSEPASNAELPPGQPPESVRLEFTEGVQLLQDAIRMFDSSGSPIDGVGDAEHGDTDAIVEATLPELEDGTYVVDWRVVSKDSHPINGAYTFSVGEPTASASDIEGLLSSSNDRGVGIAFGITRALAFGSVLVLLGALFFLRTGVSEIGTDPTVRSLLWVCWVVGFVTSFLGIGMQAAYSTGQDIGGLFDWTAIGDVMDTRFGQSCLVRAFLLVLVIPALRAPERPRNRVVNGVDGALAIAVLATFSFAGHARTGRWTTLATVTDIVHLAAAAAWLGGVAVLVTLLVRRTVPADAPQITTRFSRIAAPAIATVAVTGAIQGWRQTDGLDSVFDTTYGRLLLTKIGLVVLIVAAASVSRHIVRLWSTRTLAPAGPGARRLEADPEDVRELRNAVVVEVIVAALVIAVTAVLVNTTPARVDAAGPPAAAAPSGPGTVGPAGYEETLEDEGLTFDVSLSPGLAGLNTLGVEVTDADGAPFAPIEITAELTNTERGIELPAELGPTETAGGYDANVNLLFAGEWELEIRALRTEIDESVVTATITVG